MSDEPDQTGMPDKNTEHAAPLSTATPAQHSDPSIDFDIDELELDKQAEPIDADSGQAPVDSSVPTKPGWKEKLRLHWPPGKKEWITVAIAILVVGLVAVFVLAHIGSKPSINSQRPLAKLNKEPTSTLTASTLSGLPVNPGVNKTPVTGVMIENSDGARPQSGLSAAGVVFEAIAEGGITRFLALYQDTAPSNVGPIRSARPYYLQWALGFDASLAHVGGSPDALNDIKAWGVKDLNEMYNGAYYHRISSRQAPHNVYTSIGTLNQLEVAKGYTSTNFTGFLRKRATPSKNPTVKSINMNISWSDYAVHYDYDSATNSYNRSEAGAPMVDANTAKQLSPTVVVAMIIPLSQGALDTTGAYYSVYQAIGSGPVYVFQDGTLTTGTWTKSSPSSQIKFINSNGQPLKLDPGQTWITALGSSSQLSYAQ